MLCLCIITQKPTLLIPLAFYPYCVPHVRFTFLRSFIMCSFLPGLRITYFGLWTAATLSIIFYRFGALANPVFLSVIVQLTTQLVTSLLSNQVYSYTKTNCCTFRIGSFSLSWSMALKAFLNDFTKCSASPFELGC